MRAIVVGSGILGASAAYHLAVAGVRVTVVDAAHDGKATSAGAGIVCPWATKVVDPAFYAFYRAGAAYYAPLVAALGDAGETALGYRKVGALVTADDPGELAAATARVRARAAEDPGAGTVEAIDGAAARALFPPLRPDRPSLFVSGAARVDARLLAAALLRAAVARGAQVRTGTVDLVRAGHRVVCRLDGVALEAEQTIVAGGAWAPAILGAVGVALAVAPQRGQIVHLGLPGVDTSRWPVVLPMGAHYMLAFDDSRVVIGATRETGAGFDFRVTAGGQAEVLNFGLALAPGLASATVLETRVGFRPAPPGTVPMLGRPEGIDALVVGNGLGAGGLTMGPLAGRMLAQIALGQATDLDLAPYGLR
jgi:D-amino-acid dehydrogenase